ncbi:facilitated trehalose transporter Tret1-like [Achroia grisella]|uniref:facilitated trehalose transporter Tret1-like n=1 Tax=Achroia grisella TaxID=688607 RepID=UPI0027D20E9A|nr:facilitated trehalose transporter Tret1-like [Achroia grisella]
MSLKCKFVNLMRQCLVIAGVMVHSLVLDFSDILLPPLHQDPNMNIYIESWIESINGLSFFPGVMIGPFIMRKYGRRKTNLVSAIIMIIAWSCIFATSYVNLILASRFLQGIALDLSSMSATVLISEYTTPIYRGAFLSVMTLTLLLGGLIAYMIGSFLIWNQVALFCLSIAILDAIIITISPDTPVFLATNARYDECRMVFHWLRGFDEKDELDAMIKAAVIKKSIKCEPNKSSLKDKVLHVISFIKRPDFYKPLIIMLHSDILELWCGYMIIETYAIDILTMLLGDDINVPTNIMIIDVLRIIFCLCAIPIHTKINRCTALKLFIGLNVLSYMFLSGYAYLKEQHFFKDFIVGSSLLYLLVFSFSAGSIPLVCTVSSEIFPLEYKEVSTMITTLFASLNITLKIKTFPYLIEAIGMHGTFLMYAILLTYALIVTYCMLPETKDKTLQNIEEEYWIKPSQETNSQIQNEECLHICNSLSLID